MPSESAIIARTGADHTTDASPDVHVASVDPGDDKDDGAVDGHFVVAYVDLARNVGEYS